MKDTTKQILAELVTRYPALADCEKDIMSVYEILQKCFADGHRYIFVGTAAVRRIASISQGNF